MTKLSDTTTPKARTPREGTKRANLIAMRRGHEGATIKEITAATGWQFAHGARRDSRGAEKETRARGDLRESRRARAGLSAPGGLNVEPGNNQRAAAPVGAAVRHSQFSKACAVPRRMSCAIRGLQV
jgi:hypothetical protein